MDEVIAAHYRQWLCYLEQLPEKPTRLNWDAIIASARLEFLKGKTGEELLKFYQFKEKKDG